MQMKQTIIRNTAAYSLVSSILSESLERILKGSYIPEKQGYLEGEGIVLHIQGWIEFFALKRDFVNSWLIAFPRDTIKSE